MKVKCTALYVTCFSLSFPYDALLPTQSPTECSIVWKQLGNAIDTTYEYFAMAADRMVVAVRRDSFVHVFSFDEESDLWVQIGDPIEIVFSSNDYHRLALSSDGDVLAISDSGYDSFRGRVKIFALNSYTKWSQVGDDIFGEVSYDLFGYSLDISADGTTVGIGAPYNGGGIDAGQVTVYNYNKQNGSWIQKGQDLNGEAYDLSGLSVAMSRDGNFLAIGAPYNDGNGSNSGHVRIYQFIHENDAWNQLGADIDGEAFDDYSGYSVAMSGDGLTLAIGAIRNDGNGSNSGHVRVYRYNQTKSNWFQLGNDIDGGAAYDESGFSVDMSNDGTTVVIGAPTADRSGANNIGQVRTYRFVTAMEDWAQVGGDIYGDASDARLGLDVSMSGDSTMIGALGQSTTALKLFKRNTCDPTHPPSFMPTSTSTNVSLHFITTDIFPRHSFMSISYTNTNLAIIAILIYQMLLFRSALTKNKLSKLILRPTDTPTTQHGL